jgi:hypothetical protein
MNQKKRVSGRLKNSDNPKRPTIYEEVLKNRA